MKKYASFLTVAIAFTLVVAGYELVLNGRAIGASLAPFIVTSCSSASPCIGGSNASSGAGVLATSANGRGVSASTKHVSSATSASYGVYGADASSSGSFNSGVYGTSVRGFGVSGVSTSNYGVNGVSSSSYGVNGASRTGTGVNGQSTDSIGVAGISTNYLGVYGSGPTYGLYGSATTGYGAVAVSSNIGQYASGQNYGVYSISAGRAVFGSTSGGVAFYAQSGTGRPFEGHTNGGLGLYVTNSAGNGADVAGSYIGVLGRSDTFPLVLTNSSGSANLMWVDGSGNMHLTGQVVPAASVRTGVRLYNPQSTTPAVEETGTAQLRAGRASVYFSANFARSIDSRRGYQVFLTPNADTRGLYVQGKYARGFIVREVAGGRGSFDFDYRVYARSRETDTSATAAEPNAPIVRSRAESNILPIPPGPKLPR